MSSQHPLVERFRAGEVPAPLKAAAARGALPLPSEDLLEILQVLVAESDPTLQADLVQTLARIPDDVMVAAASAADVTAERLDFLGRACYQRPAVLEKVLLNPVTLDATVELLAPHVPESALELLSLNQVRLARAPGIFPAMLQNARMTNSIRRRLKEIWELHQHDLSARAAAPQATAAPATGRMATAPPPPDQAAQAPAPGPPAQSLPSSATSPASALPTTNDSGSPLDVALPDLSDLSELGDVALTQADEAILRELQEEGATEEETRLAKRILMMTIPEKVQLATFGTREARMILIRDGSSLVQKAVVNSPKLSDSEIEKIANMRNVGEDILRMIAADREATKNYTVVLGLVRNPKTMQGVAMQLMQRLMNRDLAFLVKDKNIADVVRRQAGIILDKRHPEKKK